MNGVENKYPIDHELSGIPKQSTSNREISEASIKRGRALASFASIFGKVVEYGVVKYLTGEVHQVPMDKCLEQSLAKINEYLGGTQDSELLKVRYESLVKFPIPLEPDDDVAVLDQTLETLVDYVDRHFGTDIKKRIICLGNSSYDTRWVRFPINAALSLATILCTDFDIGVDPKNIMPYVMAYWPGFKAGTQFDAIVSSTEIPKVIPFWELLATGKPYDVVEIKNFSLKYLNANLLNTPRLTDIRDIQNKLASAYLKYREFMRGSSANCTDARNFARFFLPQNVRFIYFRGGIPPVVHTLPIDIAFLKSWRNNLKEKLDTDYFEDLENWQIKNGSILQLIKFLRLEEQSRINGLLRNEVANHPNLNRRVLPNIRVDTPTGMESVIFDGIIPSGHWDNKTAILPGYFADYISNNRWSIVSIISPEWKNRGSNSIPEGEVPVYAIEDLHWRLGVAITSAMDRLYATGWENDIDRFSQNPPINLPDVVYFTNPGGRVDIISRPVNITFLRLWLTEVNYALKQNRGKVPEHFNRLSTLLKYFLSRCDHDYSFSPVRMLNNQLLFS